MMWIVKLPALTESPSASVAMMPKVSGRSLWPSLPPSP
jgi:hypothetical protein